MLRMSPGLRLLLAIVICGTVACAGAAAGFLLVYLFTGEGPLLLGGAATGCFIGLAVGIALFSLLADDSSAPQ